MRDAHLKACCAEAIVGDQTLTNPADRGHEATPFRAEFFNLLNHPQFANPDSNVASPTLGVMQQYLRKYSRRTIGPEIRVLDDDEKNLCDVVRNLLLLSTARGAGIAVDSKTKQETFMKVISAGGGLVSYAKIRSAREISELAVRRLQRCLTSSADLPSSFGTFTRSSGIVSVPSLISGAAAWLWQQKICSCASSWLCSGNARRKRCQPRLPTGLCLRSWLVGSTGVAHW